ncbi:MAG: NUDIX domain-containing protein [Candidatus Magasanikbacteria bacterium]|nr:NUDIX domain-containing protein [Candidatus Magasanikbacteria bacterium]
MPKPHDYYQISLKLLIKNKNNEILLLKVGGNNTSAFNGYYDFPGGRIDESEFKTDFKKIIQREVEEEIGGEIKYQLLSENPIGYGRHEDFSHRLNKDVRYFYLLFESEVISCDIKISDEHVDYVWMPYKEIKNNLEKLFVSGLLECAKMYFK